MGVSRQEYWSGAPFPSPGELPDPGTEPGSPSLQAGLLLPEPPGKPQKISKRAAHRNKELENVELFKKHEGRKKEVQYVTSKLPKRKEGRE